MLKKMGLKQKKHYPQFFKRNPGFTLIELLVVIAIIGLLASVVLISLLNARKSSRDAKRVADIKQLQKALEMYIDKVGPLPTPASYGRANSGGGWSGWWDLSTNTAGNGFMNFLVTSNIVTKVPVDPLNTPAGYNGAYSGDGYFYAYYIVNNPSYAYPSSGQGSCMYGKQRVYLLGIRDLETDIRPAEKFQGSGCSCLWTSTSPDRTNYFSRASIAGFDYIVCGYY